MERRSADPARLVVRCPVSGALARGELLRRFESFASSATDPEHLALLVRLDRLSAFNRLEGIAAGDALLREVSCRLSSLEGVVSTGRYSSATLGVLATPSSAWGLARAVADEVQAALDGASESRGHVHVAFVRLVRVGGRESLCVALDDALAAARSAGPTSVIEASVATCDRPSRARSTRVLLVEDAFDLRTLLPTGRSEIVGYERTRGGALRPVRDEAVERSPKSDMETLEAGLAALSRGQGSRSFTTNVCRATVVDPDARRALLDTLNAAGDLRERWGFEVDESTATELPEATSQFARELVGIGSSMTLDGFVGDRPSALGEMSLAGLKLDESLVSGLPDDVDARASFRRAVSTAAELRVPLYATRVVHGRAREMLVAAGVSVGQGPWLGPLRVLS